VGRDWDWERGLSEALPAVNSVEIVLEPVPSGFVIVAEKDDRWQYPIRDLLMKQLLKPPGGSNATPDRHTSTLTNPAAVHVGGTTPLKQFHDAFIAMLLGKTDQAEGSVPVR
jgi:hypothetical protein